ncbi:unnamed protein product [Symbiodinium sp. KB8]|nr:unnamed protein product [Symbiodinium sp. KB8]
MKMVPPLGAEAPGGPVSRLLLLTAALAELVAAVAARHRSEAPASKAVELLEKLWRQGRAELNDEAVRYERLKQWCTDTAASKKSEIEDGEEKEERTSAVVERTEAAVAAVQEDIEELVAKASKLDEKRSHTEKRRQDEAPPIVTRFTWAGAAAQLAKRRLLWQTVQDL